jgi:hypothetical protein
MIIHCRTTIIAAAILASTGWARAQEPPSTKAQEIKDTLVTLCLAGGSESSFTAEGDLEFRAKIKDLLTGNVGSSAGGKSTFSKKVWEGIIGGISKDMTNAQSQQASEARKCMVENGFPLMTQILSQK